jgi:hypothetical protein
MTKLSVSVHMDELTIDLTIDIQMNSYVLHVLF